VVLDILKHHLRPEHDAPPALSRRAALATAVAGATAPLFASAPAAALASAPGRMESRLLRIDDPVEKLKAEMRMYRALSDEADVLLWYHWTAFIVAEGRTVAPLVRYEGIEFSHHRRIGENLYRAHGHNLSYPRDLMTNAFIERVRNPVTGKEIAVPPTVLLEDPGMLYSPAGKRPLDRKSEAFTPRFSVFRIEADQVKVEEIRVPPDNWVTPFIESSHNWSAREAFDNPAITRLPMETAGVYVFPFPRWLEMGDVKGHMVGYWSGRKLEGVDQLPAEFYQRTESWRPELLRIDMTKFDT
jgi:hypothetical protein